jgi:transposase
LEAQHRIAELEATVAAQSARIAEQDAEIAAKDARIVELEQQVTMLMAQVAALTKQVGELTEKLGQNSRNSHLPPSSDPPGSASKAGGGKRPKSERKRGGQPGHRGTRRDLVPEDQVDEFVDLFPAECENCWAGLPEEPDSNAKRHQVVEVPCRGPRLMS